MNEKQFAKLSESCRMMRDSSKANMFRSGAANEESDGLARYSEQEMAAGNLGGTARKFSSQVFWDGGLIFLSWSACNLGGTARREARPKGMCFSIFI